MAPRKPGDHNHLHVHGTSSIHRLAPEAKLLGLTAFVAIVAVTPRHWVWVFGAYAVVVASVCALARVPARVVLGRLAVITPFVAFALFLPLIGDGDQHRVAGLELSTDGLWASWNIIAKATLGATSSILVAATTPVPDLLAGLSRLRVPAVFVAIIAFMFRYLDLIVDQLGRMRRAMTARGHDARWLWQVRPIAASAGTLFVRTYERGERVHSAMVARGFTGTMPELHDHQTQRRDWLLGLLPALSAAALVSTRALV